MLIDILKKLISVKSIVVDENEIGIRIKNNKVVDLIKPGKYRFVSIHNRTELVVFEASKPIVKGTRLYNLLQGKNYWKDRYFRELKLDKNDVSLVFKDGKVVNVLQPNSQQLFLDSEVKTSFGEYVDYREVVTSKFTEVIKFHSEIEFKGIDLDGFIKNNPEMLDNHLQMYEMGEDEVGILYRKGELYDVLAPKSRHLYWKDLVDVKVDVLDVSQGFALPKAGIDKHDDSDGYYHPYTDVLLKADRKLVSKLFQLIELGSYEAGLLYRKGKLMAVLQPDVRLLYWKDAGSVKVVRGGNNNSVDLTSEVVIEVYDLTRPEFMHSYVDIMVNENRELVEKYFHVVELGEYQVGLVYKNDKLADVLKPTKRQLYWKGPNKVDVDVLDIEHDFALPKDKAGLITHTSTNTVAAAVVEYVYSGEIADSHTGLLIVDGELVETLQTGLFAYWNFNRNISVEQLDMRMQAMDVQGQEILTKDKVSLRINLSAQYQIVDPVTVRSKLNDMTDFVYRELQLALRQAVGTRTLDALLGNKDELDLVIFAAVKEKISEFGIQVHSVGLKDVILPGEMKDILNKVVEAEKLAQANVIKRREETAATRSLLNTTRLMDDNPTLMRLKELEVLEKVTEKIDKLTVFDGLDGIMRDTIRFNMKID